MRKEYPCLPLVGVSALINYKGKILLIKRARDPAKCLWSLPGGLVELGEKTKDSIRRELLEELGLSVEPTCFIGVEEYIESDSCNRVRYHFVILVYLVKLMGYEKITPSDEVADYRWVNPKEALKMSLTVTSRKVIKRFISGKVVCLDS